tara:strand:+ start:10751 stop:11005 length:255 start_codon:yes stop_codon:yes gene_type:complete
MLPQLPQDKANHFIYGLAIFIAFGFAFGAVAGLVAAALIGAAKEVYDKVSGKGCPDALDFVATAAGGVAGYLCTYISVGGWRGL